MNNAPQSPTVGDRSSSDSASLDELLDVLANERRRVILAVLAEEPMPVDIASLARAVTRRETDATDEQLPTDVLERVQVSLHHVHLPKMDDRGVLVYDREGVVTEKTPKFDLLLREAETGAFSRQ
ncbi:MAG: hypothetical protein ABEJ28_07140 [Salinigranum sp.]